MNDMLYDIVLLLFSAVVVVPIAQRLGLGAVLGYLLAGVLIGPSGFRWITAVDQLNEVSELGVVFLLFILGLELDPRRLWSWKVPIFGMGSAQVLLVTALSVAIGVALGLPWSAALVIGLAFAMSGTAIASQILQERGLLNTTAGSSAFSILLFQDIAVIPILALLPLLAGAEYVAKDSQPVWKILVVIAGVIVAGRLLLRHIFRLVAASHQREIFTALCLLMVVGLAALMHSLGVSMGLGAFLGGVLLATSEYRHAVETDIEPFKGLLLGLFFMSVGMGVDLSRIAAQPVLVFGLLVGLIALKIVAHSLLARLFRMSRVEVPMFSMVLAQAGEFSFVLLGTAVALGLLANDQATLFSAVAAISMGTTPLLMKIYDRWIAPLLASSIDLSGEVIENDHPEVIIAGFGRVGQIVGRLLYANRIRATVLDHDPDLIESVRRFGFKVYYGDATRVDLLESAGARTAKIMVVAVDEMEPGLQIVDLVKEHFPHLRVVVRARNMEHVYKLIERGVEIWERETFDSSVRMGTEVLRLLGMTPYQAVRTGLKFRAHNLRAIYQLEKLRSNRSAFISANKQARDDLEKLMTNEGEGLRRGDDGWDVHPEARI